MENPRKNRKIYFYLSFGGTLEYNNVLFKNIFEAGENSLSKQDPITETKFYLQCK